MRKLYLLTLICFFLSACGFHLQGKMQLAKPLRNIYLQTPDPYGTLARSLVEYLKMSKVTLASSPQTADTILVILQDNTSEELLSVSSTQQTRQYNLKVTVKFEITDAKDRIILAPQSLTEIRVITVQANQILGSSNEANLYYQQMRRAIAYAIMNRINSKEVSKIVVNAFDSQT